MPERTPYLTVNEAAAVLRVHPHVVYRLVQSGEIVAIKVGRQWRIPRAELETGLIDRATA
jgi:excisionase family DNA binding protein